MNEKIIKINFNDFEDFAIIGTEPTEREIPQKIILNISISYDATDAIKTDDLHNALDYQKITYSIKNLIANSKFFLLETLADEITNLILEEKSVLNTTVSISKPNKLDRIKSIGVEISKTRK